MSKKDKLLLELLTHLVGLVYVGKHSKVDKDQLVEKLQNLISYAEAVS